MNKRYNFKNRVGEKIHIKSIGDVEIIKYDSAYNCDILVIETKDIIKNVTYSNIKAGSVKNPYKPILFGVGFMGEGVYISRHMGGEKTKVYKTWRNIIERCYRFPRTIRNKSYEGVTVCEEWHNFQNFAKWFEENYNSETMQGWQLDKDILVKGNKIYSPETCCFVPPEVNILFKLPSSNKGLYPQGVHLNKKSETFICRGTEYKNRISLGSYKTEEEAFNAYKKFKESYAKKLAEDVKNTVSENVYRTIKNYKVEK